MTAQKSNPATARSKSNLDLAPGLRRSIRKVMRMWLLTLRRSLPGPGHPDRGKGKALWFLPGKIFKKI
jgi:hypothetical protein